MPMQVVNDLNSLIELIESFYLKYGKNAEELKGMKNAIEELKASDFHLINNINNLNDIVEKTKKITEYLKVFLPELSEILFGFYVDYKDYPILREYLINRKYYSQEERNNAFQKQLKNNDYDIYLINGLNLVNLFNPKKIVSFDTENDLKEYIEYTKKCGIEVIIKPKTDDFETEYRNYYNYLLKHGYNYSINDQYDPLSIATELASLFDGQVLTEGFIIYAKSFSYPEDFNNEEYIEKIKEFLLLHNNKSFVKDYKEMSLLEKKIRVLIDTFSSMSKKYINIIKRMKENSSRNILGNEILFLEKCYTVYGPRSGYWDYIYEDYYRAIDAESLRNALNDNSLYAWKISNGVKHYKDKNYKTCVYSKCFSWESFKNVEDCNEKLKSELDSMDYSDSEVVENLIQDKYIIEANSKLDYDTLLSEYYSNFGMDPKEFVEMIQLKYDCKVVCPDIVSQSTKLTVRKAS